MPNCNQHKNPLHNTGTSQYQRLLPGLDKNSFARVDEKEFADWIVFAAEFGKFLNYYNQNNAVSGNWSPFFSSDIAAQLGTIAIQQINRYRLEVQERFVFIQDDDNKAALDLAGIKLNELFSALFTLSKAMDDYAIRLPDDTRLKPSLKNLIQPGLAKTMQRLIAYYKAADALGYLNKTTLSYWAIMNKPLTQATEIILNQGLSNFWFDDTVFADWNAYVASINGDDSIYQDPLQGIADPYTSMQHAVNHNVFSSMFDEYLAGYSKIILDAETELLKTLQAYDAHTPHYALFLSFLRLFRFAQDHINTLTQRHLDFYYREVLQLQPRPALANKVHVLAELAKQVDSYLLKAGTALKAGKDSEKKELIYAIENDAVFTKAAVVQFKTWYKAVAADTIFHPGSAVKKQDNAGRIFASPVSNSADGAGAKLSSEQKEWHPFISKTYKEARLESIAMPKAAIGFALASHYLYLTEGQRKITLRLVLSNNAALNNKRISCYLTTEKDWLLVDNVYFNSTAKKLANGSTACTELVFTIPGSQPAIVNYNAKVHGGSFNVDLPILKIILDNEDNQLYQYNLLDDLTITTAEIKVDVGMDGTYSQDGLKNLLLSSDFGALDAAKPFMPFGSAPTAGNRLVIGSKEIFCKQNTSVKLNLEWKDLPDNRTKIAFDALSGETHYPNVSVKKLVEGKWTNLVSSAEIFENYGTNAVNPKKQVTTAGASLNNAVVDFNEAYTAYDLKSNKGFIALQLTEGFGHKNYLKAFTDYVIAKATVTEDDDIATAPVEPYTPLLQSLYASYTAYQQVQLASTNNNLFKNREIRFFQLHPFGEAEAHKALNPAEPVYLLPQFKHVDAGETKKHVAEFYIGIEKLYPEEAVSLLFQLMEGTTNPKVAKPADHIHWSYLSDNRWLSFKKSGISDSTLNLVQSGIISFAIPANATTNNQVLPAGFIWLKAAVSAAPDAVCSIINVHAQAALAAFSNNDNAADFFEQALPAATISKLKIPDAAVKKIDQPYASFGGRPKEDEAHFYVRVSERLRHKNRGITVWDYEHLVLEAFPEIYKVKCLNHTQIEDGFYHEVKPGYVSIITIPSLQNRNDSNPLKPYTQQRTLTNIENYLRSRISCFVNLRACQPQFEEVRISFSLKLYEAYKDFNFYAKQLQEEITQFLSPWAFGDTSTIDFGGKLYKSVLINFIEERYYVDFITDVILQVKVDDASPESGDLDEVVASTARSILVSAPASKHMISQVTLTAEVIEECPGVNPQQSPENT